MKTDREQAQARSIDPNRETLHILVDSIHHQSELTDRINQRAASLGRPVCTGPAAEWFETRGLGIHALVFDPKDASLEALQSRLELSQTFCIPNFIAVSRSKLELRPGVSEFLDASVRSREIIPECGNLMYPLGLGSYNQLLHPLYFARVSTRDNGVPDRIQLPSLPASYVRSLLNYRPGKPDSDELLSTASFHSTEPVISCVEDVLGLAAQSGLRPSDLETFHCRRLGVTAADAEQWVLRALREKQMTAEFAARRVLIEVLHAFGAEIPTQGDLSHWVGQKGTNLAGWMRSV